MVERPAAPESEEVYRREAMGAFSHEIRTPLTSIRMVMELARREADEGALVLDDELATMLQSSVNDLERLSDDLQEASRIERGRLTVSPGPCHLAAAFAAAAELLAPKVTLTGAPVPDVEGPWDAPRVVRALAAFAESANRIGDGSGLVHYAVRELPRAWEIAIVSGAPGGEPKGIAADASFGFFRSRLFILAIGGRVSWERSERHFAVTLELSRD
jgi:signal transduction histidine kinase